MPDASHNFSVDLATAPDELAGVYQAAFAKSIQEGMKADDADKFAAQQLHLCG